MAIQTVTLPWGKESLSISLPEGWHLNGTLQPSPQPAAPDPAKETLRSLQSPIGSPHLLEMVKPDMKIALVVDDSSRPTPVAKILPAVITELQHGGANLEKITLVTAIALHRPMSQKELAERIGAKWLDGQHPLRWENHECDNMEKLVLLGTTSRGTPVYINKTVAEADLVISIGCIEPHSIASFGGGYKNLIPGVAGRATIAHNHSLNCQPTTYKNVGQPIEHNPMRLDMEEGGQMLKPPVFIVNAVLNSALKVVHVVCGDPIQAHRDGVRLSASIYGVNLPTLADVVITSSHPMDQDLRQGVKALANNINAVRKGGVMIVLVRAEEGVGVFGLANRKLPVGRSALKLLAPLLLPLVSKLKLKGMGEEDRFFLYFALQAMRHCTILIYAPTLPVEIHEKLPFVTFVDSLEKAIDLTKRRFPKQAEVIVIPHGGSTYPILA